MSIEELPWILNLIWRILPAYIANASPLVLIRRGHPIDGGRTFIDGKPVLGAGKTIEGFLAGIILGTLTGLIQGRGIVAFMLSLGAMCGDLLGSFIKRRIGIKRGRPAPILDQTSFLLGALAFSSILEHYTLMDVVVLIVITIPLHLISNIIAYLLKIKRVPW